MPELWTQDADIGEGGGMSEEIWDIPTYHYSRKEVVKAMKAADRLELGYTIERVTTDSKNVFGVRVIVDAWRMTIFKYPRHVSVDADILGEQEPAQGLTA